jgi:hypothetical protein
MLAKYEPLIKSPDQVKAMVAAICRDKWDRQFLQTDIEDTLAKLKGEKPQYDKSWLKKVGFSEQESVLFTNQIVCRFDTRSPDQLGVGFTARPLENEKEYSLCLVNHLRMNTHRHSHVPSPFVSFAMGPYATRYIESRCTVSQGYLYLCQVPDHMQNLGLELLTKGCNLEDIKTAMVRDECVINGSTTLLKKDDAITAVFAVMRDRRIVSWGPQEDEDGPIANFETKLEIRRHE